MNIQEAKQEICNTLRAYNQKDEAGRYCFPRVRQRPILLLGPPGVGKTAIMEQAAEACGVGLVSYTMTHHTRQSALGLPRIETRIYDGKEMQITEYTLSEIIASVYDCIEQTGNREGILFLDEINCVSETLAPAMLQFLQNKTFGSQPVPEGWLIVAAGNPPEYNKSVREFDIVTLDRVRRITIEPDLDAFLSYAAERQLHGAILSYLTIKPDRFYRIEQNAAGKEFVTARGWEDLSAILQSYESLDIPVTESLVGEYLQKADVARDFAAYYRLYCKYGTDYGIDGILAGDPSGYEKKVEMAKHGGFEERFTVVNLMLEGLLRGFSRYRWEDGTVTRLHEALQIIKRELTGDFVGLETQIARRRHGMTVKQESGLLTREAVREETWVLRELEDYNIRLKEAHIRNGDAALDALRGYFSEETAKRAGTVEAMQAQLCRAFAFLEAGFGEGQEMVLFLSGLTRSPRAMDYISRHGCPEYLRRSQALLYKKQELALQEACKAVL